MQFDPENNVVKLCAEGMEAEATGNTHNAFRLFTEAWESASNDFEYFTAAHYLARHQPTPADALSWNLQSLHFAEKLPREGMEQSFPSLYLNVAKCYEETGDNDLAAKYYQLAAESALLLPAGKYTDTIKMGINEGLKRTGAKPFAHPLLEKLVDTWCEERNLRPLALILPAYTGNMGTEADTSRLISSLSFVNAIPGVKEDEKVSIAAIINELTGQKLNK